MRKISLILAAVALSLTACSGNSTQETTVAATSLEETTEAQTTVEETTTEAETTTEEETTLSEEDIAHAEMVERSHLALGNNYRIQAVLEKAQRGEDITIAYLGGSITEGYNAGTTEIYAKLTSDYIRDNYANGGEVNYVNAGLSGTPSSLGIIRSEMDVFQYDPDILFIEFAVNDGGSSYDKNAFDSLIMKQLERGEDKACIALFSVTEAGYSRQDDYQLIAFHYQIPMISVKNAIWPEIEDGSMLWTDWSNDDVHPNEYGQALYAEFIDSLIDILATSEKDEQIALPDELRYNIDLTDMVMYDKTNLTPTSLGTFYERKGHDHFPNGWMKDDSGNDPFTFEFDGTYLFLVYKDTTSSVYGDAEVYVDGELTATLKANSSDGWNNPVTECVYRGEESGHHTVEIKMAEDQEDKYFNILCFGIE